MRARAAKSLVLSVLRAAVRHRVNGHAAEIAFFALLSLIPATITLGGVLHLLSRVGGQALAARGTQGASEAIRLLIGPKLADSVINPFVQTQLSQTRDLAFTGLIATAWLASRALHALEYSIEAAYEVTTHRTSRMQRLIALGYSVCAVAIVAVTLALMVLGWHSGKAGLDRFMGRTPVVAQLWFALRFPLFVAILLAVVVCLYRFGPKVSHTWRQCMPGAIFAVVLWLAAAGAFRTYLLLGAAAPTGIATNNERVVLIGRAVGASIATGVWMYVSALAILAGAELNGELYRRRLAELARARAYKAKVADLIVRESAMRRRNDETYALLAQARSNEMLVRARQAVGSAPPIGVRSVATNGHTNGGTATNGVGRSVPNGSGNGTHGDDGKVIVTVPPAAPAGSNGASRT